MKKNLLILLILDLLILGFGLYRSKPDDSVSIILIFIIPFLFVFNLLLGLLILTIQRLIFKIKNNNLANAFFLNSIATPIMFYVMFTIAVNKNESEIMKSYSFSVDGLNYYIVLYLNDGHLSENNDYAIDQRLNESSSIGVLMGKYRTFKDTIYLENDTLQMKIFNHTLTGFPINGNWTKLKDF